MEKRVLIQKLEAILPIMRKANEPLQTMEQIEERCNALQYELDAPRKFDFVTFCIEIFLGVMIGYMTIGRWLYLLLHTPWVVPVCGVLCGVLDWIIWGRIHAIKKEGIKKEIAEWKARYDAEENRLAEILVPHREQILEVVPKAYVAPDIIEMLYEYLVNGRADSMKEALNLFEEEKHRRQLNERQQQLEENFVRGMEMMQEQQDALEQRVKNAEARAYAAEDAYIQLRDYGNETYR